MSLLLRRRIFAFFMSPFYIGRVGCARCGMCSDENDKDKVEMHDVPIQFDQHGNPTTSAMAICEECWVETDTKDRLYYFRIMYKRFWSGAHSWETIRNAVLSASK